MGNFYLICIAPSIAHPSSIENPYCYNISNTDTMPSKLAITDLLALPKSTVKIPQLGLGVYQAHGDKCISAILAALKAGYRHIDSAQ